MTRLTNCFSSRQVLQFVHLRRLTHGDQEVTGVDKLISMRVESNITITTANGENHDAVVVMNTRIAHCSLRQG